VLQVEEGKRFSTPIPTVSHTELERISSARLLEAGPSVPLIVHDVFVAETASKISELQESMRAVSRDVEIFATKLAALEDAADQQTRWHAFSKSEQRVRDAKLEEMLQSCRALKARIDKMEARSNGNFHAYNSFEAVSRKLAELERNQNEAQRVERNAFARMWMFCAAVVLSATIIVASYALTG
jgi:hypothetical protein